MLAVLTIGVAGIAWFLVTAGVAALFDLLEEWDKR